MARNVQRIHSGPADVTLYDSTNGWLYLGHLEKVRIKSKAVAHTLLSKNEKHWATIYDLAVVCLQSDAELYEALKTRRAYKQTIYIVGAKSLITLDNMYITVLPNFEYGMDAVHTIELTAATQIESDLNKSVNLLGSYGNFNTDTDSDGLADGWIVTDALNVGVSISSGSWRSGNFQIVTAGADNKGIYSEIIIPTGGGIKLTFSVYGRLLSGGPNDFYLQIRFYDENDNLLLTSTGTTEQVSTTPARFSYTKVLPAGYSVNYVRVYVVIADNGDSIHLDDAQLEIGSLTDFMEY